MEIVLRALNSWMSERKIRYTEILDSELKYFNICNLYLTNRILPLVGPGTVAVRGAQVTFM